MRGYDPESGRTAHTSADRKIEHVRELADEVRWILATHVHADHLSAAHWTRPPSSVTLCSCPTSSASVRIADAANWIDVDPSMLKGREWLASPETTT